jgi:hypothetical protein
MWECVRTLIHQFLTYKHMFIRKIYTHIHTHTHTHTQGLSSAKSIVILTELTVEDTKQLIKIEFGSTVLSTFDIHIRRGVYPHVCVCVCMWSVVYAKSSCVCVCVCVRGYVQTKPTYVHTHIFILTQSHTRSHLFTYTLTFIHIHTHIYSLTHSDIHVHRR